MTDNLVLAEAKRELKARMLRGAGGQAASSGVVPRRSPGAAVPMSAEQRQVWLHCQMVSDQTLYNESITIHRRGSFELPLMERALNELLRRHEIWRTAFEMLHGELVQVVNPTVTLRLRLVDVSHLPPKEREAAARAMGERDARAAIDLAKAPLMRACAVRLAPGDHRIYLTLHHIIFDGVSIYRMIVPELAQIYHDLERGLPLSLPETGLQYADYAVWQASQLTTPRILRQTDYWRRVLADPPARLELSGEGVRSKLPSNAGSMEVFEVPTALLQSLKELSARSGVTLYMTLLAAFKTLLYRYSGAEDILIGGVTDLRRSPELQRVVGYFLNTFAIRSHPRGDLTFRDYLVQVRDVTLGALEASEIPFHQVITALNIRHELGTHPLFNIFFSTEPPVDPFPDGWDLTQMDITVGAAKFDLYLEMDERPGNMVGRFLYSTGLFDAPAIQRMIGHFLTLLNDIAVRPDAPVHDLEMLTPPECQQLLGNWNADPVPVRMSSLVEAIASQIDARRDQTAIAHETLRWTYADLSIQIDRIAGGLSDAGIGKGALVAVALERGPNMVAALLAILKIGAAYLPLDPDVPQARLESIVKGASVDAILVERLTVAKLPQHPKMTFVLEDLVVRSRQVAEVQVAQDDLAYVIYTSGSTGAPKGVEVTHGALNNLLTAMRDKPGFTSQDILLAVTTISFDIAALEIFLPLLCGGQVVIATREQTMDPLLLADLLTRSRATVLQATPAVWQSLVESGWQGAPGLVALCGGAALSASLADELRRRVRALWNMYGPTETTIWSLIADLTATSGAITIGWPIANTIAHILDKHGNLLPVGVPGELFIGGKGLARGYRGRPDLTAEKFVTLPAFPGQPLYQTGDLARRRPQGAVICLGRLDHEEKIRGFRVAVEEVEEALLRHPSVATVAVRSWPDASGGRSLAAYVVPQGSERLIEADLRDHMRAVLPDYMVPSSFDIIPALPMTPNRKVDRNALAAPSRHLLSESFVAPEGPDERRLAGLWRETLGVDRVGRFDRFSDLGGHSLLVANLLLKVREEFGLSMGVAEFFQADRLADMSKALSHLAAGNVSGFVPIQPLGRKPPLLWLDAGANFLPLSAAMGQDQPFLGVPILSMFDGDPTVLDDLPLAASFVADNIRKSQPQGPYYLGGFCTFGILAYEVARQLRAAGEEVPLLVLVHAINPAHYLSINRTALLASRARFSLKRLVSSGKARPWQVLGLAVKGVRLALLPSARVTLQNTHPTAAALELAAYRYVPGPFDGAVLSLQPLERVGVLDTSASWTELVKGDLTAHDIPGAHETILKAPFVEMAGRLIGEKLCRIEATATGSSLEAEE